MPIQMTPRGGAYAEIPYAPHRDITYLYPNAVQVCENLLWEGRDKDIDRWMKSEGVTEDDLAETIRTFCLVLNEAHKSPEESWLDILKRTGFEDQPAPARIALMYYIGTTMAGTFFMGLRDVVPLGGETVEPVKRLCRTSEEIARYLALGRWGRKWYRLKRWWQGREKKYSILRE